MSLQELQKKLRELRDTQLVVQGTRQQLLAQREEYKEQLSEFGIDPDGNIQDQLDELQEAIEEEGRELLEQLQSS